MYMHNMCLYMCYEYERMAVFLFDYSQVFSITELSIKICTSTYVYTFHIRYQVLQGRRLSSTQSVVHTTISGLMRIYVLRLYEEKKKKCKQLLTRGIVLVCINFNFRSFLYVSVSVDIFYKDLHKYFGYLNITYFRIQRWE